MSGRGELVAARALLMARYVMNLNTQQVADAMGQKSLHNLSLSQLRRRAPANGNIGEQFSYFF